MTPRAISVPEMHFGRYVALAMLLVVASFSATLAVSQWRLQPIEALALEAVEQLKQIDNDLASDTSTAPARSNGILQARRGALRLAMALGMVSLIVAVIAGILVLRVSRGRDRLMVKHGRLLAERATELEAFAGRVAHDLKNPLGAMAVDWRRLRNWSTPTRGGSESFQLRAVGAFFGSKSPTSEALGRRCCSLHDQR